MGSNDPPSRRGRPFVDRPLVYIAAPYTHPDPVRNTHDLIQVVDELADDGLVTPVAPHLTLLWHLVAPRELEFWYEYDLAMLARCDALLRLAGPSKGADREAEFAAENRLAVFYAADQGRERLATWAKAWRK